MRAKNVFFIILGCISLGLGSVGIVVPVLPTVPFYLLTVFCFAKGSERLHRWFVGSGLYKKHLESFVNKKGMTVRTKVSVMLSVTLLMGFGFFMMKNAPVGRIILAAVWIAHIICFVFFVKTCPAGGTEENKAEKADSADSRVISE